MQYKKLVHLRPEQKEALDNIKEEISFNGGYVSVMRLINDSIQIFIDHYGEEAVERYSPMYAKRKLTGD
ncbi:MAG: hypothetical protein Q4P17_02635 [Methanobacterium sp.]|nr:hypothetical protein [Methanobacterium sp.]